MIENALSPTRQTSTDHVSVFKTTPKSAGLRNSKNSKSVTKLRPKI